MPPINLWLDGRLAAYKKRITLSGIPAKLEQATISIRARLKAGTRRRRRRTQQPLAAPIEQPKTKWEDEWVEDESPGPAVLRHWRGRLVSRGNTRPRPVRHWESELNKRILDFHRGLRKAESAILVQARTGCIGLAAFLARARVPGYDGDCNCGTGRETVSHVITFCPRENGRREELVRVSPGAINITALLCDLNRARALTRWLIQSGRISQYTVARRLLYGSS